MAKEYRRDSQHIAIVNESELTNNNGGYLTFGYGTPIAPCDASSISEGIANQLIDRMSQKGRGKKISHLLDIISLLDPGGDSRTFAIVEIQWLTNPKVPGLVAKVFIGINNRTACMVDIQNVGNEDGCELFAFRRLL